MRKLEKRAIICLALAFVLIAGICYYVFLLWNEGGKWISLPSNRHIYKNGYISTGEIYDTNGNLLVKNNSKGKKTYNGDSKTRKATLHVVGDNNGNIRTGANVFFADKLVGYNFFNGVYRTNNKSRKMYLTIDSDISRSALEALGDRNGTVGVYNYKTGAILCMVSTPTYDPTAPPKIDKSDKSGIYINKFISYRATPGSIFKLVTSAAAIENLDYKNFSCQCKGKEQYGKAAVDTVKCVGVHGYVDFSSALAKSCNVSFGRMAMQLGGSTLKKYTKKAGLMNAYSINGIPTAQGSFDFPSGTINLAWTGIGQYHDMVNPFSMLMYVGAIAGGGKTPEPYIIKRLDTAGGLPATLDKAHGEKNLIKPKTSDILSDLMKNNVKTNYGQRNFPNLDIYAKSGTAEVGFGKKPHSWFVGFIKNKPYAFVVLVEHGGYGSETAGSVANKNKQKAVNN